MDPIECGLCGYIIGPDDYTECRECKRAVVFERGRPRCTECGSLDWEDINHYP